MVSRPLYVGGLGFGLKWDMGWMHDTLAYFARDPVFRKFHHNELTFRTMYASTENFVLPLSHDEVVHGKGSLLGKMPGDEWQKLANLRLLFAWMWAQPGKKLLFMGGEIGQWREWSHDRGLDWHLLDHAAAPRPAGLGPGPQPPLPRGAGAPRARLRARRLRVGGLQRLGGECPHLPAARALAGGRGARRVQLHPAAAAGLPGRRAAGRTLAGAPEQRRRGLRRRRLGQPGRPRRRARAPPRAAALAVAHAAPARRRLPQRVRA